MSFKKILQIILNEKKNPKLDDLISFTFTFGGKVNYDPTRRDHAI